MSSPEDQKLELERALRDALSARASTVHVEPDLGALSRRIAADEHRSGRRGRIAVAAAVLVVAAGVGGACGSFLVPTTPTQHAYLSSSTGNQGGSLPTGPSKKSSQRARVLKPRDHAAPKAFQLAAEIRRTTHQGTQLVAFATRLDPVAISSGTSVAGCYAPELVSTTAIAGSTRGGSAGVVQLQPLAANGLEVVDSGSLPTSSGEEVWWATVAVGSRVARVAAEQPGGVTDAMRPDGGIAVLGGLAAPGTTSQFFSVVAEDPAGQSLEAIGFLPGWGPKAIGTAPASAVVKGCGRTGVPEQAVTTAGSQPAAPLLATASVVAAFHQAYAFSQATDLVENLAAVDTGRTVSVSSRPASAGAVLTPTAAVAESTARQVEVSQVTFLSDEEAAVVYRTGASPWRTGAAVLTRTGVWQVSRATFCGEISSGTDRTAPAGLARAC